MQVRVINASSSPPFAVEWQTYRALRFIRPDHVMGVGYIRLEDRLPELNEASPDWARRAVAKKERVYGWYAAHEDNDQAHIVLYVRQIYNGLPGFMWWTPLPTLRIVRTLAHEVAHHL